MLTEFTDIVWNRQDRPGYAEATNNLKISVIKKKKKHCFSFTLHIYYRESTKGNLFIIDIQGPVLMEVILTCDSMNAKTGKRYYDDSHVVLKASTFEGIHVTSAHSSLAKQVA